MRSKKRVTHRDVAKHAGVSTAVVSYVINNGPRPTSLAVRERVIAAIQELDYHPNVVARGLRARRTNTIGFIVNDYSPLDVFVSPYSAKILTGLTVQLKSQKHYVLVYPLVIGDDLSDVELLLRGGRLDGVVMRLVQDPPETDALLELIAATHIPCVCIERSGALHFGFSSVIYDDRRGAYDATSALIARGHRRIGHICGDRRYSTARARLDGYQRALTAHRRDIDEALIAGNSWNPAMARASTAQLLALPDPPTALFAASDNLAFNAIEELRARGLQVPEDIAVIGFDDIGLASELTPPLSTVQIPLMELGQRAADLILEAIQSDQGQAKAQEYVMPVELIHRGTT
jgi:DNA-binding LacI/PurR family transcriptional regulator